MVNSTIQEKTDRTEGTEDAEKITIPTGTLLVVSSTTNVKLLSLAISNAIKSEPSDRVVQLRAVGAGAINQANKGFVRAKMLLVMSGWRLLLDPYFEDVERVKEDGTKDTISAMIFTVVRQHPARIPVLP